MKARRILIRNTDIEVLNKIKSNINKKVEINNKDLDKFNKVMKKINRDFYDHNKFFININDYKNKNLCEVDTHFFDQNKNIKNEKILNSLFDLITNLLQK